MAKLNEIGDTEKGQYMLGRLRARKFKREGFQKGNEIGKHAEKATQKNKNVDGVDHMVYSPSKYDELTNAHANGWHDEMRKDENRNMKQQLKLNESELYSIIEGAVKNLVLEYLPYFDGKAAARGLEQGDTSPFERFMQNGLNRGWTKDDMTDFQSGIEAGSSVGKGKEIYDEDFEDLNDSPVNTAVDGSLEDDIAFEGKRAVKVNESQLFNIIRESVNNVLSEISDTMKQEYINGRRQQEVGNRPMSNVMAKKGEKDLAKYKSMGYPCGGAENGEKFARMGAGAKATQMYKNGRGKYSWGA